jgi:hypothetical protein
MTLKTMMRRMMDQMMKTKKILNLNQRKTRRKQVAVKGKREKEGAVGQRGNR